MRIAKPLLLVTTPVGVALALREAARFHWWLAVLMGALVSVLSGFVLLTLRRLRADRGAQSKGVAQDPLAPRPPAPESAESRCPSSR